MYTFHFYVNGRAITRSNGSPAELRLDASELGICRLAGQSNLTLHPAPIAVHIPTPAAEIAIDDDEYLLAIGLLGQVVEQLRDNPSRSEGEVAREVIKTATRGAGIRLRVAMSMALHKLNGQATAQEAHRSCGRYLGKLPNNEGMVAMAATGSWAKNGCDQCD